MLLRKIALVFACVLPSSMAFGQNERVLNCIFHVPENEMVKFKVDTNEGAVSFEHQDLGSFGLKVLWMQTPEYFRVAIMGKNGSMSKIETKGKAFGEKLTLSHFQDGTVATVFCN